jgi:hypothetical protein
MSMRSAIKAIPVIGATALALWRPVKWLRFKGSGDYWERRYTAGGNSGAGSYSRLAEFKAAFLNDFVAENGIRSIIEFGSGDGAQLALATYPDYVGIDVSTTAISATRSRFAGDPSKRFYHAGEVPEGIKADLALSLDVIYHLVEDTVFEVYMRQLCDVATRFVIIYSSDLDARTALPHVRHRRFTDWLRQNRPEFQLVNEVPNPFPFDPEDPDNTSFADFYIFERE